MGSEDDASAAPGTEDWPQEPTTSTVDDSTMPFTFLFGVSMLGLAMTGYLTWSKVTSNEVVCPVAGCSNILSSPYAEIGPVPLPALGMLGYGSVALMSGVSGWINKQAPSLSSPGTSETLQQTQRAILFATSALAGTSLALAFTLKVQFPGELCAYCAASILASTVLYLTSFTSSQDNRKNWSFGTMMATTCAVLTLYATYPDNVTAQSYNVPFNSPEVTAASPPGAADLAAVLREKGAKMYGAFWCSHCFEQKQTFGRDAVEVLPYVECYPDGYQGPTSINKACVDADVQGFPTWIINGQKVEGDWPLEYLSAIVDGADPRTEAKKFD